MQSAPFSINNKHYSYKTLDQKGELRVNCSTLIFAYNSTVHITIDQGDDIFIPENHFIDLPSSSCIAYSTEGSGFVVLLSNSQYPPVSKITQAQALEVDAYQVSKPWGRELWITGESPKSSMVLKYIEIKSGTKTSLQVHESKYESNFLCQGEALYRYSNVKFQGKDYQYPLIERKIYSPTVIDVEPFTIHQMEATTDIILIEASTNHLDDVIRLKDDSGRHDGRIDSEHSR